MQVKNNAKLEELNDDIENNDYDLKFIRNYISRDGRLIGCLFPYVKTINHNFNPK